MKRLFYLSLLVFCFFSCGDKEEDNKDMQKPVIYTDELCVPMDCQSFTVGETIHFSYIFKDNKELGSYNIEIHNNFNHHTHSTSSVECEKEETKQPVKAWVYNKDFSIPTGLKEYSAKIDIPIPQDIDKGEYHFMIRLTDRSGWQELKSVAIRIL
ncbi:MAG: DUF4625 domain-containing protein [Bacteroidales bacterium]|nr:DUF4625 domain-containing protein [Bacteroidales bacterium]